MGVQRGGATILKWVVRVRFTGKLSDLESQSKKKKKKRVSHTYFLEEGNPKQMKPHVDKP